MFENLRNFGNATGSGMRRVYGIALSHSSELNMLFNSKFGFNLFNSNDVRCKINDIISIHALPKRATEFHHF